MTIFLMMTLAALSYVAGPVAHNALHVPPQIATVTAVVEESGAEAPEKGVRFVFVDQYDNEEKTMYMAVGKDRVRKMELRPALPGLRVERPADGRIVFYKEPPVAGQELKVLFEADIPESADGRQLGMIHKVGKRMKIYFIEDGGLVPGMMLLSNLTGTDYRLDFRSTPPGDAPQVLLKSGEQYLFGRSLAYPNRTRTFGVVMNHLVSIKDREPEWYVNRRFMITSHGNRAIVRLFLNDASGTLVIHDLLLFPERKAGGSEE